MVEDVTPLHLAATAGWTDGVQALLNAGAGIDVRDALLLETPLHKSAQNLQTAATSLLRERGAFKTLKNMDALRNLCDIVDPNYGTFQFISAIAGSTICTLHQELAPPSTPHVEPVTKLLSSLRRNAMTLAISSGLPSRGMGQFGTGFGAPASLIA